MNVGANTEICGIFEEKHVAFVSLVHNKVLLSIIFTNFVPKLKELCLKYSVHWSVLTYSK